MDKLLFLGNWGKKKYSAWSGTIPGLYRGLQEYFVVERLDIRTKIPALVIFRCLEKLGLGRFDTLYLKYYNRKFSRTYKEQENCKIFQFEECASYQWAKAYIYQDLSIGYLLDIYENRSELIQYCGIENLTKRYLKKRVKSQRLFYQNASGIFTMGKWLADYIIEHEHISPDKVHAVGGGVNVDVDRIDYSEKKGNKVLFVGRDFIRKGGDLVIEAFRILKTQMPEAELYIAGPKKNPVDVNAEQEGIFYLGEQNREQLIHLFNQCDIFCMPSRFEAYGLSFIEALTYGLPCVARNAFSMREMIEDGKTGYLVENDDAEILAEKMLCALRNQQMRDIVRQNKEFYIKEYSWEAVTRRIADIIARE